MTADEEQATIPVARLGEMLDAVHELARRADLPGVLDEVVRSVCTVGRFGSAVVNVVQPDGSVEVAASAGAGGPLVGTRAPLETWLQILDVSSRWQTLRYLRHDDDQTLIGSLVSVAPGPEPDSDRPVDRDRWHPDDILLAPLWTDSGDLLGALSVDQPEGGRWPDAEQRTVLELLAAQAARAIAEADAEAELAARSSATEAELRRSLAALRHLAEHDDLTGLANRRALTDRLHRLLGPASEGSPIGVLAGDLDGFKWVNDRFGHAAGDELLVHVAQRLRDVLPDALVIARPGGDEFVAVVCQAPAAEDAAALAHRCVEAIRIPFDLSFGRCTVTLSLGIARTTDLDQPTPACLLEAADRALYASKKAGKDRWTASTGAPPTDPRRQR